MDLDPELSEGWKGFVKMCTQANNCRCLNSLLNLLLTAEEREDIASRFLIVMELIRNKKTQREIAKDLNVSIAKITRGSNSLKTITKELRRHLENLS